MSEAVKHITCTTSSRKEFESFAQRVSDNGLTHARFINFNLVNAVMGYKLKESMPDIAQELEVIHNGTGAPCIVIHNAPIDKKIPPTGKIEKDKGSVSEFTLRAMAECMNAEDFIVALPEGTPSAIHILAREVGAVDKDRGGRYTLPSYFHNDGIYKYGMLYILTDNVEAKSAFLAYDEIVEAIKKRRDAEAVLSALSDPHDKDAPFKKINNHYHYQHPVFMLPNSALHEKECDIFKSIYNNLAEQKKRDATPLRRGDIEIWDDTRGVHYVSAYPINPVPGNHRAVQRLWVKPRQKPGPYVDDPEFVNDVAGILFSERRAHEIRAAIELREKQRATASKAR